ncbi:MAG: ATP-dependent DNA helicase RecG, partial [Dehalococcoidia bacterium]
RKGFQDQAVTGGLEKFLQTVQAESASHPALRALAESGLLSVGYATLDPARRERWAREVQSMLDAQLPPTVRPPTVKATEKRAKPATRPSAPRQRADPPSTATLDSPVTALPGVNRVNAGRLAKLDLHTVRDLVYHFPNRHLDYSQRRSINRLRVGEEQTVVATLWEANEVQLNRSLKATYAVVGDETGNLRVLWFGNPWLARTLQTLIAKADSSGQGRVVLALSGKVSVFNGHKQMESPEWEPLDEAEGADLVHTGRLVPVYPSTEGLYQRTLRKIVRSALDVAYGNTESQENSKLVDSIPGEMLRRWSLMPLQDAVWQQHYPDSLDQREAARRRLAFEELLTLQIGMARQRRRSLDASLGIPLTPMPPLARSFLDGLPFQLTEGQWGALGEAMAEVAAGERPMSRLLQGDVGSGKTVVAVALLLTAVGSGFQGALMAPTEVLAEQHFLNVRRMLSGVDVPGEDKSWFSVQMAGHDAPISIGLLTGSTRAKARREVAERAAEGSLDILIGTHALIQKEVEMPRLALAVVDEQHRFGVLQRVALRGKGTAGAEPHLLLMSATPIPRTLSLTLYGDLDISVIPELPAGRRQITTRIVPASKREDAEAFLVKQASEGRQSFVVCPLIEESESIAARAATAEYERLRTTSLANVRVGLLHGRMPLAEKQSVMDEFRAHRLDVLVSTPVIEVGIDVPNATVMLIEGSDRFGLAQLHQLRGRVGRGEQQSYCFLLSESASQDASERLDVLVRTNDGFDIAEADLRLRGPGDFFGTRQSGLPALKLARLDDRDLVAAAKEEAAALLKEDPSLSRHHRLAESVARYTTSPAGGSMA